MQIHAMTVVTVTINMAKHRNAPIQNAVNLGLDQNIAEEFVIVE